MSLIVHYATLGPAAAVSAAAASLTVWSRLEVLPTSPDYSDALAARIADPLWFLARQWQFGEFQGEDAGSPIEVRLEGRSQTIGRFLPGAPKAAAAAAAAAVDYDPLAQPLEPLVEAEEPAAAGPLAGLLAGLQFVRMTREAGLPDDPGGYGELVFVTPEAIVAAVDAAGASWAALLGDAPPVPDGHRLAAAIAAAGGVPQQLADQAGLKELCLAWLAWYRGGLEGAAGSLANACYQPNRMEHAFRASTAASAANAPEHVLAADEYVDGRLDWYAFDLADQPSLGGQARGTALRINPMLPSPARFGGMPADRFWEFEDGRVNLPALKAGPTDLGRMLLLDFALLYGNDWFVVPLDLPVGSLFRMGRFTVKDTFGISTDIARVARGAASSWRMFELSGRGGAGTADSFLLAPALVGALAGDALEEVVLFRDEMANMAWAVERKVPGAMGVPVDRQREAQLATASRRLADLSGVAAEVIYRVATSVPEHWIPLVPVPRTAVAAGIDPDLLFERRAMLRHAVNAQPEPIHPRGTLLRTRLDLSPDQEPALQLEDEEVPREGVLLTRQAQFARWIDGQRLHWTGRRKRAGTGEGASGLRYDVLLKRKDAAGA